MANLLDTIRSNNPAMQNQQGVTDETGKLQTLLRAKSGKDTGLASAPVAASNLGEQAATAQTNNQLQNQVAPAAAIQTAQLGQQAAGQQQQTQQATQQVNQARKFDTLETKMKTNQVLSDLERNKGQVDFQAERANLEQIGQNLRLTNQQYINDLQREGNSRRLDDSNEFSQAMSETMLGANKGLLEKQLGNQGILGANDRQFRTAMANMDINTAYDMFKNDMAAQKQRALYAGAGALVTAGIGAAGSMPTGSATSPDTGTTVATGDISTGNAGRTS